MNAVQCELCGSNEIVKQGDYLVCQHCGTKYAVEAARGLLVEVDNTQRIDNLYQRARMSREVGDFENAGKYYKKILEFLPNDWEALLYSYLYAPVPPVLEQAGNSAAILGRALPRIVELAIENAETQEASRRIVTITNEAVHYLANIAGFAGGRLRQCERGNRRTDEGRLLIEKYKALWPAVTRTRYSCLDALTAYNNTLIDLVDNYEGLDVSVVNSCMMTVRQSRFGIAGERFWYDSRGWRTTVGMDYLQLCVDSIRQLDPSFEVAELSSMGRKRFFEL